MLNKRISSLQKLQYDGRRARAEGERARVGRHLSALTRGRHLLGRSQRPVSRGRLLLSRSRPLMSGDRLPVSVGQPPMSGGRLPVRGRRLLMPCGLVSTVRDDQDDGPRNR